MRVLAALGLGECVVQACAVSVTTWPQHRVAKTGETGVGLAPAGWVVPSLPRGEAKTGGRCAGVDRVLVAAMSSALLVICTPCG